MVGINCTTYQRFIEYLAELKLNKLDISCIQIFMHDTKTLEQLWDKQQLRQLVNYRNGTGRKVNVYVHSIFKIVIPLVRSHGLFVKHYIEAANAKVDGYIVHLPHAIHIADLVAYITEMLQKVHRHFANYKDRLPTIYFEHVPSEQYASASTLVELASRLSAVTKNLVIPIGICIDTCHIYASGIPLSNKSDMESYLDTISTISIPLLIHLNDSDYNKGGNENAAICEMKLVSSFGSFVDRHATLGTQIWKQDHSGLLFLLEFAVSKKIDCIIELKESMNSLLFIASISSSLPAQDSLDLQHQRSLQE